MIGDERENLRINAWIRGGKKNGLFVRPRLFMPYYEEIKVRISKKYLTLICLYLEENIEKFYLLI
jgi:hypothetical protein